MKVSPDDALKDIPLQTREEPWPVFKGLETARKKYSMIIGVNYIDFDSNLKQPLPPFLVFAREQITDHREQITSHGSQIFVNSEKQ